MSPGAQRATEAAPPPEDEPRRILVFRIGSLGDSLVALPAVRVLRARFPKASLTLLCDRQIGKNYVLAVDLYDGSGLFEDYIVYPFAGGIQGRALQVWRMLKLLAQIRRRRFDTVVYLAPSVRDPKLIARDRRFFARSGAKRFIGFDGFRTLPEKIPGVPTPAVPHETDLLLERLAFSGIPVPPPGGGNMSLGLGPSDAEKVDRWLRDQPSDGGRAWIGVGPGSKMPSKIWPEERYRTVVARLVDEHDLWPVVVGGPEDRETGDRLLRDWGRGYNAAGVLPPRLSSEALRRCRFYLGNDTGTMHLAVAAGTPCIAIFSSRDRPGAWYPYGRGHRVLRTEIGCDVCLLLNCVERRMECLTSITPEAVRLACQAVLEARPAALGAARGGSPEGR